MTENTPAVASEGFPPRAAVDVVRQVAATTPTWRKVEKLTLAPAIICAVGLAWTLLFATQFGWDLRDSWGFFLIGPALVLVGLLWIVSTPGRMRAKLIRLNAGLTPEERTAVHQLAANYAAHTDD